MLERKLISAAVVGLALLAGAVPARAQSFRPARPPINWSQHDPANKAMHNLGYCINLHMVAWYNALQGRFSDAQLERAAALAVSNCDQFVDAATREHIAWVRKLVADPAAAGRAFGQIGLGNGEPMPVDKLRDALTNTSYAEWRADKVKKAQFGAVMYIRGVRIATSPGNPDQAGSAK